MLGRLPTRMRSKELKRTPLRDGFRQGRWLVGAYWLIWTTVLVLSSLKKIFWVARVEPVVAMPKMAPGLPVSTALVPRTFPEEG